MTTKESARRIRSALREAFPAAEIAVTLSVTGNGESITIEWAEGPGVSEVQRVAATVPGATQAIFRRKASE